MINSENKKKLKKRFKVIRDKRNKEIKRVSDILFYGRHENGDNLEKEHIFHRRIYLGDYKGMHAWCIINKWEDKTRSELIISDKEVSESSDYMCMNVEHHYNFMMKGDYDKDNDDNYWKDYNRFVKRCIYWLIDMDIIKVKLEPSNKIPKRHYIYDINEEHHVELINKGENNVN